MEASRAAPPAGPARRCSAATAGSTTLERETAFAVRYREDGSFVDGGERDERAFDLVEFNPMSADLHLAVGPCAEGQVAVWQAARPVAGSEVCPRHRSSRRSAVVPSTCWLRSTSCQWPDITVEPRTNRSPISPARHGLHRGVGHQRIRRPARAAHWQGTVGQGAVGQMVEGADVDLRRTVDVAEARRRQLLAKTMQVPRGNVSPAKRIQRSVLRSRCSSSPLSESCTSAAGTEYQTVTRSRSSSAEARPASL